NDTLVAVASRHLVADRHLALLGEIDLHELDDARRQLVGLEDAVDPLFRLLLDPRLLLRRGVDDLTHPLVDALVLDAKRLEVDRRELHVAQRGRGHLGARRDRLLDRPRLERERDRLAVEQLDQLGVADLVDANLLVALETPHFADPLAAVLLDHLVLYAREDLDVDHHAFHARRNLERRVLHVLRLLAEDRREQLLFRAQLGLALWRDLADEDVARFDVRADADDAALVEIEQRLFRDVRDLARDLFLAALGVADVQFELLNVDRQIDVVLHQALGEDDGVLEVVPVPGHERHGDVRAERELALLSRRAVGQHVAGLDLLALRDERTLVDRG